MTGRRPVVLSLGSNLGDRLANLQLGVDVLVAGGLGCPVISPLYETAPVGGPEQDDYLNAVLLAATSMPPQDVLCLCAAAEAAAGRARSVRFGPRTLDVDIITYGDETSADPELTLPHPRAHVRAFVLVPWLDIDPDAVVPGRGAVTDLVAEIGTQVVRRRPELALTVDVGVDAKGALPCA